MRTFIAAVIAAVALTLSASAQIVATITNSVTWDQDLIFQVTHYDVTLATNKTRILTNGYAIPATAVIATATVTTNRVGITNLWPQITNGVFSVFVEANGVFPAATSTNLVIEMRIPPLPSYNLRLQ